MEFLFCFVFLFLFLFFFNQMEPNGVDPCLNNCLELSFGVRYYGPVWYVYLNNSFYFFLEIHVNEKVCKNIDNVV